MKPFLTYWPVIFRAFLYFLASVLPVFIGALSDCLKGTTHWSSLYGWWVTLSALFQGVIAIRAFYDGAAQRHTDQLNGTNPFAIKNLTQTQQTETKIQTQ